MLILVTYDVNTETPAGRARLRKVAKCCVAHGQRVQNSVFECLLDQAQFILLKGELEALIDKDHDSLRFYNLGNTYQNKIQHLGAKRTYDPEAPMVLSARRGSKQKEQAPENGAWEIRELTFAKKDGSA